jgi:hypothetical protein
MVPIRIWFPSLEFPNTTIIISFGQVVVVMMVFVKSFSCALKWGGN